MGLGLVACGRRYVNAAWGDSGVTVPDGPLIDPGPPGSLHTKPIRAQAAEESWSARCLTKDLGHNSVYHAIYQITSAQPLSYAATPEAASSLKLHVHVAHRSIIEESPECRIQSLKGPITHLGREIGKQTRV